MLIFSYQGRGGCSGEYFSSCPVTYFKCMCSFVLTSTRFFAFLPAHHIFGASKMKLNCWCFVYFLVFFMDFRPTNYPGEQYFTGTYQNKITIQNQTKSENKKEKVSFFKFCYLIYIPRRYHYMHCSSLCQVS